MAERDAVESPPTHAEDAVDAAVSDVSIARLGDAQAGRRRDAVAREEPLEIRVGGAALAVVMRTPGHDEELALGFLVTEGVIASLADVGSVRHCGEVHDGDAVDNVIRVVLKPGVAVDLEALRRNFYATSSCGICGKASIERALATSPALVDGSRFDPTALLDWPARLAELQTAFARTGGLHAAGLFGPEGALDVVREDVGRHNAVDKVLGWALRAGRVPLTGHGLLVSGRCSFEVVQKALAARVPLVAAVSAPTSLAVEFAAAADMTLVGFLRGRGFNVYSGGDRLSGA
jgi:FdhD protein